MAAFARDTTNENHSFAVGLHICLSLDRDGNSITPLDPTWIIISSALDRTESCLLSNLYWCKASSHLLRTCFRICVGKPQSLHQANTWPLYQRARLALVGRESIAALYVNLISRSGRELMASDQHERSLSMRNNCPCTLRLVRCSLRTAESAARMCWDTWVFSCCLVLAVLCDWTSLTTDAAENLPL